jgi:hypothetical protein
VLADDQTTDALRWRGPFFGDTAFDEPGKSTLLRNANDRTFGECRNAAAIHQWVADVWAGGFDVVVWLRRAFSRSAKPRSIMIWLTYTREKSTPNRFLMTD